ncbi:MAG: SpaA isopeptide-forming pilin-related protein [Peptoniphilus sp.]|uniref:SpaA isopeptide-forming pilin-related protein n=1 Tax=Peptoniphilus sp. TaxID=1971214 RepID=UPI003999C93B
MDNIFKRFTCLLLAFLMVVEVFSPVAALAAGLIDDSGSQNSTRIEENISGELFNKPATKAEKADTRNKEEVHKKTSNIAKDTGKAPDLIPAKKTKNDHESMNPAKQTKNDYEILVPAKEKAKPEAKAAEEAKAKEEQAAKEKEDLAKIEKEKQEALKIEAERQAQAARANDAEAAAAEAEYREAHQKRLELEQLLEEKLKEKGLRDQKKQSEKSLNAEESNKLKNTNKEENTEEEEEKGLLEKIKEGLGLTDLQRADKELKKALKNKKNGLEEIQALLNTFEDKYDLSREDQAKLMADNTDAFREFIESHGYENFDPQMFMVFNDDKAENEGLEISDLYDGLKEDRELTIEELEAGLTKVELPIVNEEESRFGFFRSAFMPVAGGDQDRPELDGKKFNIITRFDTSTVVGPIKKGQYFRIHLDDKLTVNDSSTLKPITKEDGTVIATPSYNSKDNTITYTIPKDINENLQIPLNIPVDYNTSKKITLDSDGTFTVVNKVSGLGVKAPRDLIPTKVNKYGIVTNQIIEPGRNDVEKIIDPGTIEDYKVDVDGWARPVIEKGELAGYNWTIKVLSNQDLQGLGYKANFTTVKGSGLGVIENKNAGVNLENNPIKGSFGIVDSKHHEAAAGIKEITYNFYTPVQNKQAAYMMDFSVILTEKGKVGAKRFVAEDAYNQNAIGQATPTRVGMNNRTTILGKFAKADKAKWTVTDAVSTGDDGKLPLANRQFSQNQTINTSQMAVYGLDANGKMVEKQGVTNLKGTIPAEGTNPAAKQDPGTIAVYEYDTNLQNSDKNQDYILNGVSISKYRDLYVTQIWNLPVNQEHRKTPKQTIKAVASNDPNTILGSLDLEEKALAEGETERLITIPNVRYWDIDENGNAKNIDYKIEQTLPSGTVNIKGTNYKYVENANYYRPDYNDQLIRNTLITAEEQNPVTFKVKKVDSKTGKGLAGARFKLWKADIEVTTDANGEATFTNIVPDNYQLIETKAPNGYKIDQQNKAITINKDGKISLSGNNATITQGIGKTETISDPKYPDYMNVMHYGKLDKNGNLEFYIFLKALDQQRGGDTDRKTRLNIDIPGVNISGVDVFDVNQGQRPYIRKAMEDQNVDNMVQYLGTTVLNRKNTHLIKGETLANPDPYTNKTGYQIIFPKERFEGYWGFLVRVKANVGANTDTKTVSYDWLTDKDTASNSKIRTDEIVSSNIDQSSLPTITVTNEEFKKSPIEITKFGDEVTEVMVDGKKTKKRNVLGGAEFTLKDKDGNPIATKITDDSGKANFGDYPTGTYILEETQAPNGHEKSKVYFEVTVNEKGEVTYDPKYLTGSGEPIIGEEYDIQKTLQDQKTLKSPITNVSQRFEIDEDKASSWGTQKGVWEAYRFESLMYHADISFSEAKPGQIFEIQFDKNLDFTQYSSEFPKIKDKNGTDIADPYFDYKTNLLTYVFNKNAPNAAVIASLEIKGIIPSKFYAKNSGDYYFTIEVGPGMTGITGTPKIENQKITAYYDTYDRQTRPTQAYYFRDIYKQGNDWYITAIAYYNPESNYSGDGRTLAFNWMSTKYNSSNSIAFQEGVGVKPAFDLIDVKVYRTEPNIRNINGTIVNENMPLSFGVRPEQDPNNYYLVNHTPINPESSITNSTNGVYLKYDPSQITSTGGIYEKSPLTVAMPRVGRYREGYLVEQTFKVTNLKNFINLSRAFYMDNGKPNYQRSAFITSANFNQAKVDQVGAEIPSHYKEDVGLINYKYKPGQFKIIKTDEFTRERLKDANFALRDADGKIINRTSDSNGEVIFNNLAPGRYTLKETKAPEKHTPANIEWQITVFRDGSVKIVETSVSGSGQIYEGNNDKIIELPVKNRPTGTNFQVFKKDGDGSPLKGAKFKITKQVNKGETGYTDAKVSDQNGTVNFEQNLTQGTYIIEEIEAPDGYKKLDKKWVLVIDDKGNKKVYNYRDQSGSKPKLESILEQDKVNWVDVAGRSLEGWSLYDNRRTGWTGNYPTPYKMGTRIVAINRNPGQGQKPYVIQRYVLNPEGTNIDATSGTIHRERLNDPNMDWFNGSAVAETDYQVFELDKPVTGVISDIRLAEYNPKNITKSVTVSEDKSHYGETRMKLDLPKMTKPVVIDIKVPYTSENGGVGTGMDWTQGGTIYWKSDFYEKASIIKESGPVLEQSKGIQGSYISDNSLEVTNDLKTYDFKIKKYKEGEPNTLIEGAIFKLTGPDKGDGTKQEERIMTTGKDGMISFEKLKPGTYILNEETPAPGYKKVDKTWIVTVGKDGKTFIKEDKTQNLAAALQTRSLQDDESFTIGLDDDKYAESTKRALLARSTEKLRFETYGSDSKGKENSVAFKSEAENNETLVREKINAIYGSQEFYKRFPNGISFREVAMATYSLGPDELEISDEMMTGSQRAADDWEIVDHQNRSRNRAGKLSASYSQTKITAINKVDKRFRQVFLIKNAEFLYRSNAQFYREPERSKYGLKYNDGTIFRIFKVANGSTIDRPLNKNDVTASNSPVNIPGSGKIAAGPDKDKDKPDRIRAFLERVKDRYSGPYYIEIETSYDPSKGVGIGLDYIYGSYSGDKDWIKDSYINESDINYKHLITTSTSQGGRLEIVPYEEKGKPVTLTLRPSQGYELDKLSVTDRKGNPISVSGGNPKTFTMPDTDVFVNATFKPMESRLNDIIIDPNMKNGKVESDKDKARAGEGFMLTVTPDPGYKLKRLYVNGPDSDYTQAVENGKVVITMGNFRADVYAEFERDYNYALISFEPNGGSGTMKKEAVPWGSTYYIPGNGFTPPPGMIFYAWNIGGKAYLPGTGIIANYDWTLSAIWQNKPAETATVTFIPNGGSGSMPSQTVEKGKSYTLPSCTFTAPKGKEFDKWEVDGSYYNVGDAITVNANTNVKATWKGITVTSIKVNSTNHKTDYKVGEALDVTNLTIEVLKSNGSTETVNVTSDMVTGFDSSQEATNQTLTITYQGKTTTYNVNIKKETPQPTTYKIGIIPNTEHGSISAPNSAESGTTVTVTVNPDEGYTIDNIKVLDRNGHVLSQVDTLNNTFEMPNSDVFLKATFKVKDQTQYDISVEQTSGGNVEVNKTKASEGEEVIVKVTPQQGYEVGQVKANSQVLRLQNGEYKFKMPPNNVKISATFNKIEYKTYFVGISGDDTKGWISVDDPQNKLARAGQEVKFTVKPNSSYEVDKVWITKTDGSGKLDTLVFNGKTGTFIMPDVAVTINVTYKDYTPPEGTYLVTLGTGISGGTFEFDPSEAKAGEKIRLTVLPKQGYRVNSYKVTTAQTGVNVPIETDEQGLYFTMPKADVSVNGSFTWVGANAGAYDVKLSSPEHGTLSANFSKANTGDEIYITAKPDKGYALDSLTVVRADDGTQVELKGNKFTMPASGVTVTASFKEVGEEIPQNGFAGIPNKQIGIEPKILKKNHKNQPLAGGVFTIKKATDKTYEAFDDNFGTITALSNEKGEVVFKQNGKNVVLPKGYYLLEEIQAPLGYKKPQAPWKIEVYEENGQLKARYNGPDDTPSNFIKTTSAEDKSQVTEVSGIKYKSRMIYINPQSKTYIQRIYIDTRGASSDVVNVQINPVDKREERDTAGRLPRTLTPGVKTAYRSTYKISDAKANYTEDELDNILKYYDLSKPNVTMINTARWRPFDWGFDEDQLNLKRGVYYIDVEGFYDDYIIDKKKGEIKLKVDFYKGERKFQQANKDGNGGIKWEDVYHGSYQQGNINLGLSGKDPGDKYDKALGKTGGRIFPALDKDKIDTAITNISIKSLYSSDAIKHIPQEGMKIVNDEETYNVTFSKHGQDDPKEEITSEAVTKRRLEGAVFKLEKARGTTWDDVDKSYVASAFNGFFGFRGLGPGRYRLIEVKAPEGYAPIKGPLLYFTIETVSITSGQLANPKTGRNVDIDAVDFIFPDGKTVKKFKELDMLVPETGKTIKITEASNIDIETTDIVNPVTKEKVKLKDLIIGFEKNQAGEYGYTYKVSEIQIVPKSNGYISLEYDKANGVYQYVPEKSTSEKDGKLIDFVTSATAKNMGKIVNTKPGKGGVKIRKIDQAGNPIKATGLKPGAQFKVTNTTNTVSKTGTVGEDGIAEIKDLPIGHYTLEEVTSPKGYINTNQVWHFTVGGKDLDPYSGDIAATGDNLSDKISVDSSDLKVLRPDPKDAEKYKNEGNTVIRPHTGQSLEFSNKFKLAENTKIKPGDYFDLKLSDNISLNGIFVDSTESLDLFADGVGTIAKATYNKDTNTIRYVFTDYAKTYTMVDFTNKLIAFVDLNKEKTSQKNIQVGIGTNGDTSKYKDIKLTYDLAIESQSLYGNNLNITSKIVSYDPNTGDFVHYYYINRNKTSNTGCNFYYYPNQDVKDLEIRYIKLKDNSNTNIAKDMPQSFGVDENSNNLEISGVMRSRTLLRVNEKEDLRFTGGIGNDDSYIIKVTGTVAGKDKTAYGGAGELKAVYTDGGTVSVNRWDKVYGFKNEAVTKAEFVISAVNPDNVIKLKKVNQNDLALAGAQFKIEKKTTNSNGDTVWNATGDLKKSDASGLLEFRNIDPGEYRIIETQAPDGYDPIEGPLVEFKVDKDGRIYRKVPVINDKGEIVKENGAIKTVEVEEPGIVPIEIVNKKGHLIKFKKVDGVDRKIGLQGAQFEVYYKDKEDKKVDYSNENIKLYEKVTDGVVKERRVLKAGETPPNGFTEVEFFTSDKDGKLDFYVYDDGFYALKEKKAPKGYTKIPGYIREFKIDKGELSVFDKEYVKPKESNLARGLQNMLTSETISVDKINNTFTQRIVINPNHNELTFDDPDTHLRLYVNDWNVDGEYKLIKVAVLDKDKSIDSLKETDFKSLKPSNYNYNENTNPLRYQLIAMHRSDQDYTRPNPNGSSLITEKALVVDIVGKLKNTSATQSDLKVDVYNTAAGKMIDEVTCKVDLTDPSDSKGAYVKQTDTTTKPIEVENRKAEYPHTGGMGTLIFTLAGLVLMSAAAYVYSRKRGVSYDD